MNRRVEFAGVVFAMAAVTGCGGVGSLETNPSPVATQPSESNPESSTDQSIDTSGRFVPTQIKDGLVHGAEAYFDYEGVTVEEVQTLENCGNNTNKALLTFDDSGSPEHIQKITDVLKANNVGAIFFPNTNHVSQETFDKLRSDGFWVGNHTGSHPNLVGMSEAKMTEAIQSGGSANLFRPPYGGTHRKDGEVYFNGDVKKVTEGLGKRICLWTIDTRDWDGRSAEDINETVFEEVAPGSVVLMHMSDSYNTLEALPKMISGILEKGIELCSLPDDPTSRDIPSSLPC